MKERQKNQNKKQKNKILLEGGNIFGNVDIFIEVFISDSFEEVRTASKI